MLDGDLNVQLRDKLLKYHCTKFMVIHVFEKNVYLFLMIILKYQL